MSGGTQSIPAQLMTVILGSVGLASLAVCVCGVFIAMAIFKSKLKTCAIMISMTFKLNYSQKNHQQTSC